VKNEVWEVAYLSDSLKQTILYRFKSFYGLLVQYNLYIFNKYSIFININKAYLTCFILMLHCLKESSSSWTMCT
jgi:hypothetical protein